MTVSVQLAILAANIQREKMLAEQARGELYRLHQRLTLARADARYEAYLMLRKNFDEALQKSKEFSDSPEMSADLRKYFYDRARIYIIPSGPQKDGMGIRLIHQLPSYFRMKEAMQAKREARTKPKGSAILNKYRKLSFWTYLYHTRTTDKKSRYLTAIRERTENLGHKVPYWGFLDKGSKGYPGSPKTDFIEKTFYQKNIRGIPMWNLYIRKLGAIDGQIRDFAMKVLLLGKIPRKTLSVGYVPKAGGPSRLRFPRGEQE